MHASATPAVHRELLAHRQALDGGLAIPAQRKPRWEQQSRVSSLGTAARR
ncbi:MULTISPECIES: hypothetical protein [Streptomyces]|nr:hypothetical protein [Streptomyces canus]WSZ34855.1 hypothetical protein OG806_38130 [Streptomyces sp. NBC_00882]